MLARIFIALTFLMFPTLVHAGTAPPPPMMMAPGATFSGTDETVASIGLRIEFGDVIKPSIVGAVRYTETDTSNDVTGILGEIAIPFGPDGDFSPILRILGIFGDVDVQGLAGLGFDFGSGQGLIGVGAQGDYVDGGVNIGFDGTFKPYVGVSTYEGPSPRTIAIPVRRPRPS